MYITQCMYVLAVNDLEVSVAYYKEKLDFTYHAMIDPGWAMLVRDNCRIMIGECPDSPPATQTGDHSYFAYLYVDDIDAFYKQLCERDLIFVKPLKDEPWKMREFGIETIDGHRIMFGKSIAQNDN